MLLTNFFPDKKLILDLSAELLENKKSPSVPFLFKKDPVLIVTGSTVPVSTTSQKPTSPSQLLKNPSQPVQRHLLSPVTVVLTSTLRILPITPSQSRSHLI